MVLINDRNVFAQAYDILTDGKPEMHLVVYSYTSQVACINVNAFKDDSPTVVYYNPSKRWSRTSSRHVRRSIQAFDNYLQHIEYPYLLTKHIDKIMRTIRNNGVYYLM